MTDNPFSSLKYIRVSFNLDEDGEETQEVSIAEYLDRRSMMLSTVGSNVEGFLACDRYDPSSSESLYRASLMVQTMKWDDSKPSLILLIKNRNGDRLFKFVYENARLTYWSFDKIAYKPNTPLVPNVKFVHPASYGDVLTQALGYENGEFIHEYLFDVGYLVVHSTGFKFSERCVMTK